MPSTRPAKSRKTTRSEGSSLRTCVVCRQGREPRELVQLSIRDGRVAFGRAPKGRSAYVCAARKCLAGLSAPRLAKGLRTEMPMQESPDQLRERLHALSRRRVLETLGLARRQGVLRLGVDHVPEAGGMMVAASDLSTRTRRKLATTGREFLQGEHLGAAIGADWVGAATLGAGPLADRAAYWLELWYETNPGEPSIERQGGGFSSKVRSLRSLDPTMSRA